MQSSLRLHATLWPQLRNLAWLTTGVALACSVHWSHRLERRLALDCPFPLIFSPAL